MADDLGTVLRDIDREVRAAPDRLLRVARSVEPGFLAAVRDAEPVRTGRLRASTTASTAREGEGPTITVSADTPYAGKIEASRHFFEEAEDKYLDQLKDEVLDELADIALGIR